MSAGAHAGEVGGDGVGGVPVEVGLGHVVAHGGPRVGVAHGALHVADAGARYQSGGAEGPASDVEIRVKYMLKLKIRLNSIIAKHTGRAVEQVEKDCDRDNFMSSDEAKAYGLVDEVVKSRKEIPGLDKLPEKLTENKPAI